MKGAGYYKFIGVVVDESTFLQDAENGRPEVVSYNFESREDAVDVMEESRLSSGYVPRENGFSKQVWFAAYMERKCDLAPVLCMRAILSHRSLDSLGRSISMMTHLPHKETR